MEKTSQSKSLDSSRSGLNIFRKILIIFTIVSVVVAALTAVVNILFFSGISELMWSFVIIAGLNVVLLGLTSTLSKGNFFDYIVAIIGVSAAMFFASYLFAEIWDWIEWRDFVAPEGSATSAFVMAGMLATILLRLTKKTVLLNRLRVSATVSTWVYMVYWIIRTWREEWFQIEVMSPEGDYSWFEPAPFWRNFTWIVGIITVALLIITAVVNIVVKNRHSGNTLVLKEETIKQLENYASSLNTTVDEALAKLVAEKLGDK